MAKGQSAGPATRFKPGVSGNPTGSTTAFEQVRALARQHSAEAFKTLVELMRLTDEPAVRLRAAEQILDRAFGRPAQAVELFGAIAHADVSAMSDVELGGYVGHVARVDGQRRRSRWERCAPPSWKLRPSSYGNGSSRIRWRGTGGSRAAAATAVHRRGARGHAGEGRALRRGGTDAGRRGVQATAAYCGALLAVRPTVAPKRASLLLVTGVPVPGLRVPGVVRRDGDRSGVSLVLTAPSATVNEMRFGAPS